MYKLEATNTWTRMGPLLFLNTFVLYSENITFSLQVWNPSFLRKLFDLHLSFRLWKLSLYCPHFAFLIWYLVLVFLLQNNCPNVYSLWHRSEVAEGRTTILRFISKTIIGLTRICCQARRFKISARGFFEIVLLS